MSLDINLSPGAIGNHETAIITKFCWTLISVCAYEYQLYGHAGQRFRKVYPAAGWMLKARSIGKPSTNAANI
ncbi:hypothetical protein H072_8494 [Dactylellina haptotyla CBS 200.50]|uniref:Uncharacterized protein n=1 Tax=Dactylellina haptotyla (strain CBS 200.50) TaxID=1284197 RepID=S8A4T5_DACHA|nr:hypothetical protein H072_8494 [Dactylellina haptotyla CBS 200.50]